MKIRCHHLGMVAGFALLLSLSAAADRSWLAAQPDTTPVIGAPLLLTPTEQESHPSPAPVLLLAAGLFGGAALVRWRQRQRER